MRAIYDDYRNPNFGPVPLKTLLGAVVISEAHGILGLAHQRGL